MLHVKKRCTFDSMPANNKKFTVYTLRVRNSEKSHQPQLNNVGILTAMLRLRYYTVDVKSARIRTWTREVVLCFTGEMRASETEKGAQTKRTPGAGSAARRGATAEASFGRSGSGGGGGTGPGNRASD